MVEDGHAPRPEVSESLDVMRAISAATVLSRACAVTAFALGVCALSAVPAVADRPAPTAAAHDTKPPKLTTPVKARFVVGSRLGQFRDSQENNAFYDVPMRLAWKATDNTTTNSTTTCGSTRREPSRTASGTSSPRPPSTSSAAT